MLQLFLAALWVGNWHVVNLVSDLTMRVRRLRNCSHEETHHWRENTVKPVLSGHSKIGKTKVLKTNGRLMKVESIAECSKSILQYF